MDTQGDVDDADMPDLKDSDQAEQQLNVAQDDESSNGVYPPPPPLEELESSPSPACLNVAELHSESSAMVESNMVIKVSIKRSLITRDVNCGSKDNDASTQASSTTSSSSSSSSSTDTDGDDETEDGSTVSEAVKKPDLVADVTNVVREAANSDAPINKPSSSTSTDSSRSSPHIPSIDVSTAKEVAGYLVTKTNRSPVAQSETGDSSSSTSEESERPISCAQQDDSSNDTDIYVATETEDQHTNDACHQLDGSSEHTDVKSCVAETRVTATDVPAKVEELPSSILPENSSVQPSASLELVQVSAANRETEACDSSATLPQTSLRFNDQPVPGSASHQQVSPSAYAAAGSTQAMPRAYDQQQVSAAAECSPSAASVNIPLRSPAAEHTQISNYHSPSNTAIANFGQQLPSPSGAYAYGNNFRAVGSPAAYCNGPMGSPSAYTMSQHVQSPRDVSTHSLGDHQSTVFTYDHVQHVGAGTRANYNPSAAAPSASGYSGMPIMNAAAFAGRETASPSVSGSADAYYAAAQQQQPMQPSYNAMRLGSEVAADNGYASSMSSIMRLEDMVRQRAGDVGGQSPVYQTLTPPPAQSLTHLVPRASMTPPLAMGGQGQMAAVYQKAQRQQQRSTSVDLPASGYFGGATNQPGNYFYDMTSRDMPSTYGMPPGVGYGVLHAASYGAPASFSESGYTSQQHVDGTANALAAARYHSSEHSAAAMYGQQQYQQYFDSGLASQRFSSIGGMTPR